MNKRLLIVEDEPRLRRMLTWELADRGYRIEARERCSEALAAAKRCRFDVALIDYHLPDGDGLGLLKGLREIQPGMKVLVCSGMAPPDLGALALDSGAFAFLAKPLDTESLDRSLRAALEARGPTA